MSAASQAMSFFSSVSCRYVVPNDSEAKTEAKVRHRRVQGHIFCLGPLYLPHSSVCRSTPAPDSIFAHRLQQD